MNPLTGERPEWQQQASCRGMNPNLFFPTRRGQTMPASMKVMCAACPARIECLTYAIEINDRDGWFAGTTPADRRGIRKRMIAAGLIERSPRDSTMARANVAVCGTASGYKAHIRRNETSCEPCLVALREQSRRNTAAHRARRRAS